MQTLIVKIDTASHAAQVAGFLKTVPYIKSVITEKTIEPLKPLTAADWVRPGRPATEEELEQLAVEMEQEKGGYTTAELKKRMQQWKAKQL
ncbi:MAG: hypothetical protein EPN85_06570 [Bacteroidetes bacterium]|nr:MAG: hypothetical protein EPN85_06570 [Bacteroidota bacterium]